MFKPNWIVLNGLGKRFVYVLVITYRWRSHFLPLSADEFEVVNRFYIEHGAGRISTLGITDFDALPENAR